MKERMSAETMKDAIYHSIYLIKQQWVWRNELSSCIRFTIQDF